MDAPHSSYPTSPISTQRELEDGYEASRRSARAGRVNTISLYETLDRWPKRHTDRSGREPASGIPASTVTGDDGHPPNATRTVIWRIEPPYLDLGVSSPRAVPVESTISCADPLCEYVEADERSKPGSGTEGMPWTATATRLPG